ncbi:LPD7 domain-containing protein [Shigella sonnei]|uniref:LPD7 domain-containing protein n=1 Tax=Shigella sonnei TaxID=624 RepID=UPI0006636328|nr:LPD7 domain-containing protein [Shigella sonnei]CTA85709.1 DNA primase [Shigella sonnei]CTB25882.1 DNA primase [Shigella sonnei]CTC59052.1 DNA primase [Shigella sonnei]CTC75806.1 DNA primase [Shigella sonnei]
MEKRTYLAITKEAKKEALRAAGRLPDGDYALEYDRSQKVWFAKAGADLEKVKAWLPENIVSGQSNTVRENLSPVEEFAQKLEDAGFILPDNGLPEMDGKRHRVSTEGDKAGTKSGVYQGFLDGRPAGWYQNHRSSEGKVNWTSTGTYQYDPVEAIKQRALAAQKRWDREIKAHDDYARIAKTLSSQWSKMPDAPNTHAYLARKGVTASAGVKLDKYDNLVIPLRNTDNELRSLQYIKPDGTKNLKKGAEKTGNYFVVGGALNPQVPLLYAEGYATAASLHQATGMPVIMTVDAGNMVTVSRKLSELYPDSAHIILGEDDFTKDDNKGLNKAREAAEAIGGTYIIPQFTESERALAFASAGSFSDFNDIHASRGIDAVRDQLAPVLDPLLPDWRQAFNENNSMPDNQILPEPPTELDAGPAQEEVDLSEYADFMSQAPASPVPEDSIPGNTLAEPVTEPGLAADTVTVSPAAETSPESTAQLSEHNGHVPVPDAEQPKPEVEPIANPVQPEEVVEPLQPVAPEPAPEEPVQVPVPGVVEASETESVVKPKEPVSDEPVNSDTTEPEIMAPAGDSEPAAAENGFSFTFGRHAGDISPGDDPTPLINLDELLQGLTSRQEGRTWIYSLDGQDAFRDYGDRIVMATPEASENDRMILAALLSAKANQRGAVEITGSDEFIQRTMGLIADHNIDVHFKNPQQREQFEALLKARAENTVPQNGLNIGPESGPETSAPVSPAPGPGVAEPAVSDSSARPKEATEQAVTSELSVLDKETLRTGLTGKLLDAGKAPYKFDKSNSESFYVQMRTKSGNKTYWGVELEQALKDSGNQPGDMVKLQYLGKKAVTVNVPVKDAEGNVTGFERLDTHRNHWTVTPALDNQLLVADKHAVAPAELAAYDGNAFWKLQQQIIQNNNLPLSSPAPSGHGLLYTSPDGKGQIAPEVPPVNAPVPNHSKAAGSVVMAALDDKGELLAHLVKGHGDYLQGVIRHEGELKNVLARICTTEKGNTYLALNSVQDNGKLQLIGHASAVNTLKNSEVNYDTFAFQMKGKDEHKFAVPLISPEKIPPALHSKLGFSQAYAPPKSEEPVQTPHVQAKPAIQPQPM